MTISVLRSVDAWWVSAATTTGELLSDRAAIDAAARSTTTVPVDRLAHVSPVTARCRVVAQMTNYASHVKDAGMDPATIPPTFFRTPVGPAVVLLGTDELKRFGELRPQLRVNGELRQNSTVRTDMVYPPLPALQSPSRFQQLAPGDVIQARVATDDSTIDLGTQRTVVTYE